MNYYIKGSAAKAEQIKAAFEKLGYDVTGWLFTSGMYYTLNCKIVNTHFGSNEHKLVLNNPDYKELGLQIEPKFKVGDKVIYGGKERTITFMDDKFYGFDGGCAGCRIELQDGLLRPAPKPHYNIGNFHAGMPVLVRADNVCRWDYSVFSRITGNKDWQFAVCNGVMFTQCIPFNKDTEHLLGTTDMCDEQYINW